jgi:hypothetical protein
MLAFAPCEIKRFDIQNTKYIGVAVNTTIVVCFLGFVKELAFDSGMASDFWGHNTQILIFDVSHGMVHP